MMELDDARSSYEQAVAILSGASMMLPTIAHLRALQEAMQEQHEVHLITIMHDLDMLKNKIGNHP